MSLLDRWLVAAGYAHWRITRRGRSGWIAGALLALAFAAIVVPVVIVAVTPQPEEATFEQLQLNLVMSSWVRVQGELRPAEPWPDGTLRYSMREPGNEALILTVVSPHPLATGPTEITGRISGGSPVERSFGVVLADERYEPPRNDPWVLLAIPAFLAVGLVVGGRAGYPVLRADRAAAAGARPLVEGQRVAASWSGRIGDLDVPFGRARPCRLSVVADPGVCEVTIADAQGTRTVNVFRAVQKQRLRVCSLRGSVPGIEAHGPALDLLFAFDDRATRDRFAAALETSPLAPA
jgi:hypothetical protein